MSSIAQLVVYPISEAEIQAARDRYASLNADTREGYEQVREAIAHLRGARTTIEKRRVELKADALSYGRRVDSVAKKLTDLVTDIEGPLKAKRDAVDNERERLKREAEMADMIALEAKLKAEREIEEAKAREERAAAEARLRVETARQAEVEAAQRTERAKLDAERAALDEQRQAMVAVQRKAAREQEQQAQAERDRQAALQAEAEAAIEAARLEHMRPDIDRVRAWATEIRRLASRPPAMESEEAAGAITWSLERLEFVAVALDGFKAEKAA